MKALSFRFSPIARIFTLLALMLTSLSAPAPARAAATITVTTSADDTTTDTFCSLREAIANADADAAAYADCPAGSGADTIQFANGVTAITLGSALPNLTDPDGLTVNGGGDVTISGNDLYRVFVAPGVPLTLNSITITHGKCVSCSGAVYSTGTLTVNNSTFSNNDIGGVTSFGALTVSNSTFSNNTASAGGGIYSIGSLTITNSVFSGNTATGGTNGGGIYTFGTTTIANSSFVNNTATGTGSGGAIYNDASPAFTVTQSSFSGNSAQNGGGIYNSVSNATTAVIANNTFSGNTAISYGGGLLNSGPSGYTGTTTVKNSSFSGNTAPSGGGGIYNYYAATTFSLYNTIVANSLSGGDCVMNTDATVIGNNNLIKDTTSKCGLTNGVNANIVGSDPNLGALAGSPAYFPLNVGSPAINAGDDAICAAAPVNNTSQNGETRPIGTHCDIGSFEYNPNSAPTNISLSASSIAENQAIGTTIGSLSTTDADAGDTHSYAFACAAPGANDASFQISGASLRTNAVFDYETKASYAICIRTNDGHGGTFDKNFAIAVTNVDEVAPTVVSIVRAGTTPTNASSIAYTVTFSEAVTGVAVNDFTMTKSGTLAGVSVSGVTGSGATRTVTVNTGAGSGTLRLDIPLAATITDALGNPLAGLPFTAGQTYTVTKTSAPTDISLSNSSVAENKAIGTAVGSLSTTDPNAGDTFTYTFCGGADDASFTLSGNQLLTNAVFDYEPKSSYSVCIRSTDNSGLFFDETFAIAVTNVLEQALTNGGFEKYVSTSKIPATWKAVKFGALDGKDLLVKKFGKTSVKMTGASATVKKLTQTRLLAGSAGNPLTFTFYVKGSSVPKTGKCMGQVILYNGTTVVQTKTLACPNGTYAFTKKSVTFTAMGAYTKIAVRFTYSKASGTVWFDGVSLMR